MINKSLILNKEEAKKLLQIMNKPKSVVSVQDLDILVKLEEGKKILQKIKK